MLSKLELIELHTQLKEIHHTTIKMYLKLLTDEKYISFIKNNNFTPFKLKIFFNYLESNNFEPPKCLICGILHTRITMGNIGEGCSEEHQKEVSKIKRKNYYVNNYGVENPSQIKCIKDKKEETCLKNYGVKNPFQSNIIKNISKNTLKEKYGVEHPMKSDFIKNKQKEALFSKYGFNFPGLQDPEKRKEALVDYELKTGYSNWNLNPEVQLKIKETSLQRYGVEHPMKSDFIKNKQKEALLKTHGVEYPCQNKEIFEKQIKAGKRKRYEFILNNEKYKISGYEPQALNYLLKVENIEETDIAIYGKDGMPSIKYIFKNKNKVYHPDIYIKSQNRLIEVKSIYTYTSGLDTNLAKQKACIDQGYNFNFYIMNRDSTLHKKL